MDTLCLFLVKIHIFTFFNTIPFKEVKPTRPTIITIPPVRVSQIKSDGFGDLTILEKESPKTKDPATRHMLQNFFDNVKDETDNKSPYYLQLIPAKGMIILYVFIYIFLH